MNKCAKLLMYVYHRGPGVSLAHCVIVFSSCLTSVHGPFERMYLHVLQFHRFMRSVARF